MNVDSAPTGTSGTSGTVGTFRALSTWRPRMTLRARLTLTYAGMVMACGVILIGIVYLFMRYVPTYAIMSDLVSPVAPGTEPPLVSGGTAPTGSDAGTISTISISSTDDILNTILLASGIAIVVLAIISGVIGWFVAGRVIRPLKLINEAATLAATGSLGHRVGLTGPRDEITDLSTTFDDMLGKLDHAFQAHRRFAANASHELRTPLATTQAMIDVALADPEADAATLRLLASRIHEVNRSNIHTVEALLALADIGQDAIRRQPVDLLAITAEVVGMLVSEAGERDITISNVSVAPVVPNSGTERVGGDPILVRQAVRNLIQNAIQHNVSGGSVSVNIQSVEDAMVLTVTNTGTVVSADVVDTLLEPFVRGSGRTAGGGHGLGLAIASSIAHAHGATLTLLANPAAGGGGLTAILSFPH